MNSNMERLKKLLEDKGLKPTYQRLKVLEYLDRQGITRRVGDDRVLK